MNTLMIILAIVTFIVFLFVWPGSPLSELIYGIRFPIIRDDRDRSWGEQVTTYQDLPPVFLPLFEQFSITDDPLPTVVLIPTYYKNQPVKSLITYKDECVYIAEGTPDGLRITEHHIDNISFIEVATFLLKSWIKIYSKVSDQIVVTWIEFNTVTMCYLDPFIRLMRRSPFSIEKKANPQRDKFNELARKDLKFMNFARKSLLPDEQVEAFVYQPDITENILKWPRNNFKRLVAPRHICILTERELILIQEEAKLWWPNAPRYGGIWQYIPLSQIDSLDVQPQTNDLLNLVVNLQDDQKLESYFDTAAESDLLRLVRNAHLQTT